MLKKTAAKYGLKTISDLKKVPNLSYAGYPECDKRITCLLGLKQIYGLTKIKFVQLGTIPVTKLIDNGTVTGGDIFTTEPAFATGKYVALIDNKHIFGFQNVAPDRLQEAGHGVRRQVHHHGERGQREADERGDDRDEQGGRASTRRRRLPSPRPS